MTIQQKATEQHFSCVVQFITLKEVVLTFESADGIPKCDHSNEAAEQHFSVVLAVYYVVRGGLTFEFVD